MHFDLDRAVEVLERTPGALSALLTGLSEEWALANEGENTFSARDVVGHLLHGEETDWILRVEIILNDGPTKPFPPFDRFAFREAYRDVSLDGLLRQFAAARSRSLARLKELEMGAEALGLEGNHPDLGRVTLRQLLATWVAHDLSHVRQVARVMAKLYQAEVGPWERYLRVFRE